MVQNEFVFHPVPTPEDRLAWLDVVYGQFLGNEKAVTKLRRMDYDALGFHNHVNPELNLNVAFFGPSGVGKSQLARLHNKARQLPFVEVTPRGVRTLQDLFDTIGRTVLEAGLPLVEVNKNKYSLPPLDIFLDEVHACSTMLIQGLLTATEYKDRRMITEKGYTVDCRNVHWMIATTERGKLFDAFDTRFQKISLSMYDRDTVARIVQVNHPEWSLEVCRTVAYYCSRVPREAVDFSREMQLEYNMNPAPWAEIAKKIAQSNDIDEYGMLNSRLLVLKALARGPVAEKRLPGAVGVKQQELEKFLLPWLLEATDDQGPLITVTHRGYALTEDGLTELRRRNIPYCTKEYHEDARRVG